MIPAGLTDQNTEFFASGGKLYSLSDGLRFQYPAMPARHINFLKAEMEKDPKALNTLQDFNEADKIMVFGICRFGGCNATPDLTDGECTDPQEYYNCGIRGKCRYEGIRCKEIVTGEGIISPRQLEIMIMVSNGLLNKEIADRLDISENTVHNHIANIITKIGGRNRVDIAAFIKERGIT